jgi:hypothetical protein
MVGKMSIISESMYLDQTTGIVYQKQFIKNGEKVRQFMVASINNIYDNCKNLDFTMKSKSP